MSDQDFELKCELNLFSRGLVVSYEVYGCKNSMSYWSITIHINKGLSDGDLYDKYTWCNVFHFMFVNKIFRYDSFVLLIVSFYICILFILKFIITIQVFQIEIFLLYIIISYNKYCRIILHLDSIKIYFRVILKMSYIFYYNTLHILIWHFQCIIVTFNEPLTAL